MTTRLTDLDEYFSPGLVLTVLGGEYTVPLASAELGLWCRRVAATTGQISSASDEAQIRAVMARIEELPELPGDLTLAQRTLGAAYEQMSADGVPDVYIEYCGITAYVWIVAGEEAAARWWQSGGRPEAHGPANRQERRAAAKRAGSSRTTSTGGAATTRARASGSGTKSPTTGAASRSRGTRSSSTGA